MIKTFRVSGNIRETFKADRKRFRFTSVVVTQYKAVTMNVS